jgi:hypothetical protein
MPVPRVVLDSYARAARDDREVYGISAYSVVENSTHELLEFHLKQGEAAAVFVRDASTGTR